MRRHFIAVLATAALVLGGLGALPAQAATDTTAKVTVTVTTPGGGAIENANVTIESIDPSVWDSFYGTTDASGTVVSDEMGAGTYDVKVSYRLMSDTYEATKHITVKAGTDSKVAVELTGIQALSGKVTAGGKAITKGLVVLTAGAHYYNTANITNGTYSMVVKPGISYSVAVTPLWDDTESLYLRTYAGNTVREIDAKNVTASASTPTKLDIAAYSRLGRISGVVYDSKGKRASGAYVSVSGSNRTGWGSARTRSDGTYTVLGLPAGNYQVFASTESTDGYFLASASKATKVVAGRTAKVSLKIPKTVRHKGAISLKVKASKTVWKRPGGVCAIATSAKTRFWAGSSCTTTSKKPITITGLPAGTYNVALGGTNTSYKVVVKKNRTTKKTVTRPTGTTVSGTVRGSNGKVLKKASVSIYDANGTSLGSTQTSSKGRYSIPGAIKGTYTLRVYPTEIARGTFDKKTFTVKKGKKATVNVKLLKGATITGKIVNSKGKGIAGMNVYASGSGVGTSYGYTVTNSKGEYKLTGLLKGTYKVAARDPYMGGYYNTKSTTVKVSTGKAKRAKTLAARAG